MDLVASCKDKLTCFRVKELKDVLTELGLSKQGKKQVSGAADLASKSQGFSDSKNVKHKEEVVDSYQMDKIRCPCGSPLPTDSMIKCEDTRCNVRQHIACVVIPEKPVDGVLPNPPEIFYCEICRLSRADPFWATVAHPLYPVRLNITNVPADGSNPGQSIEKTFQLTRADKDLLSKQEYDVQAWCMLLNDKVTFRMQWPQYADLQVNGVPVRATNRPGSQLLGANGRDDGPIFALSKVLEPKNKDLHVCGGFKMVERRVAHVIGVTTEAVVMVLGVLAIKIPITQCTRDGINKISLTGCDARIFCVGVRIVKRRTLRQILSVIQIGAESESFEDSLARVRKCVGGGASTENADSDSDIEVVADFVPVNLRCPWQCPICLKNYSWETITIDPYFNRITSKMRNSGEDVAEIEVKPDGSWRVKAESDRDRRGLGELGLWHLPDGTVCESPEVESKPKPELKPVKHDVGVDSHAALKIGIKKNRNGCWEFRKPDDMRGISPANRFHEDFKSNGPNIILMSSSATGSGIDGEDASVNQDGKGNLGFSTVNGIEYESMSMSIDPPHGFNESYTATPAGDAEVIVLSDSEEETEPPMSSGPVITSGVHFPAPQHGMTDSYYENPTLGAGGSSCLDLYNTNDDEFGSSMWSLPSGGQGFLVFSYLVLMGTFLIL
ncbi:hypothetical protein DH2020_021265 [Rehmannia glutinosa]|uniref:Zinc finger PHD-type domain-containing protein n=1 Tax=Rehmannia glutinosa TaxID=99300 RepID=A0ABR0WE52_REHGL